MSSKKPDVLRRHKGIENEQVCWWILILIVIRKWASADTTLASPEGAARGWWGGAPTVQTALGAIQQYYLYHVNSHIKFS